MSQLDQMHRQAQAALRMQVGESVRKVLAHYTQPHIERTPLARDAYASAVSTVINGGQWQAAKLATSYVGTLAAPVRSLDLAHALEDRLTTPESGNAVVGLLQLWHLQDEGLDPDEAFAQAGDFAASIAETSLQGASRDALDEAAAAADREPRWRLEASPGACEWCQFIADTGSRYLAAESVPIPHSPGGAHPGGVCTCSPAPDFEGEVEQVALGGDFEYDPRSELGLTEQRVEWLRGIYGDRLTVDDVGSVSISQHVQELARVPRELQERVAEWLGTGTDLQRAEGGIYIGRGSVPDLDHLEILRHAHPRGWPEGSTWAEVGGAFSPSNRAVVVGTIPGGSASVTLHEFGHAVDAMLGGGGSGHTLPVGLYRDVLGYARDAQVAIRPYYLQEGVAGRSEMFAEAFARYMMPPADRLWQMRDLVGTRSGAEAMIRFFDEALA